MKFSDAIRVGAKMSGASEAGWIDVGPDGKARTCTIMAAVEGAGIIERDGQYFKPGPHWIGQAPAFNSRGQEKSEAMYSIMVPSEWQHLLAYPTLPPCACSRFWVKSSMHIIILHLHDIHQWSREAIAEWIGTIESDVEKVKAEHFGFKGLEDLQPSKPVKPVKLVKV